jgi:replication-associated recombination protein RarA
MARHAKALLHVNRNTVENPQRLPVRLSFVGLPGLGESSFAELISESVQPRVEAVNALED